MLGQVNIVFRNKGKIHFRHTKAEIIYHSPTLQEMLKRKMITWKSGSMQKNKRTLEKVNM